MNIGIENIKKLIKSFINKEFWKVCEYEEVSQMRKNKEYVELREKVDKIENKLLKSLTEEQRELFINYSDLNSNSICLEQEYFFKKGLVKGLENKDTLDLVEVYVLEKILI